MAKSCLVKLWTVSLVFGTRRPLHKTWLAATFLKPSMSHISSPMSSSNKGRIVASSSKRSSEKVGGRFAQAHSERRRPGNPHNEDNIPQLDMFRPLPGQSQGLKVPEFDLAENGTVMLDARTTVGDEFRTTGWHFTSRDGIVDVVGDAIHAKTRPEGYHEAFFNGKLSLEWSS